MATDIGTRIKRARERRRWTQRELAAALGVDRKTVDNWENGRTRPASSIGAIEDVLGVSLGEEAELPEVPPELAEFPDIVRRLRERHPDPGDQARAMAAMAATLRGELPPREPDEGASGRSGGRRAG